MPFLDGLNGMNMDDMTTNYRIEFKVPRAPIASNIAKCNFDSIMASLLNNEKNNNGFKIISNIAKSSFDCTMASLSNNDKNINIEWNGKDMKDTVTKEQNEREWQFLDYLADIVIKEEEAKHKNGTK